MALPVITNTARVVLEGGWSGTADRWANVWHVGKLTGTIDPDEVNTAIDGFVVGAWAAAFGSDVFADRIITTVLDGVSSGAEALTAGAGSQSQVSLPHQCSAVITWRTGVRGRSNRGRSFLPAGTATQLLSGDTSKWAGGFVAVLAGWRDALLGALSSADYELLVASYKLASSRPVIAGVVRPDIFTQRRRVGQ